VIQTTLTAPKIQLPKSSISLTAESFSNSCGFARKTLRGWTALCPAHDDHNSKLVIADGERCILIKCWVGCTVEEICRALDLHVRDLFYDSGLTSSQRQALPPRQKLFGWRRMSADVEFAAEHHWLRAESIFKAARQCDLSAMTDTDIDAAWKCLRVGFYALEISENLGRTAFQLRVNGLATEAQSQKVCEVAA